MELYKESEFYFLFCSKHSLYLHVALFPTFPYHALLTNVYLFVILVIVLTYMSSLSLLSMLFISYHSLYFMHPTKPRN